MFQVSRDVRCPYCGTSGWMEAQDTVGEKDPAKLFKLRGKTDRGFIVLECPSCSRHSHLDPIDVARSGGQVTLKKQAAGCLLTIAGLVLLGAIGIIPLVL